ncbi:MULTISPECIES: hypothetical protein [unclassified Streptomyces]|uniref:hypothetical protein n=1 Tax=unclassified Streptomyces TaxID=2593676 RepID=UPI000364C4C9|nr:MULTISPECIES: hypothetical protein [unclassified Streptomyces]
MLALYTCTDALSTARTRAHLVGLLRELAANGVRNPVCLITKCSVSEDVIEAILDVRETGLPVIVYLSYSGLGPDIERGIDHDALRANFPRLHYHQIPVIHYWRPLMPANAAPETITSVLDLAARYATCSVAVGLKVKPGAIAQMTELWPELQVDAHHLESADAVWPRQTWELLDTLPDRYPDHPIFQTNSCALAYVLRQPDSCQIHDTPACAANHCPALQRDRCGAAAPSPVTPDDITSGLVWLGVPTVGPVTWDPEKRTATVKEALTTRDRNNVSQRYRIALHAPRDEGDTYWSGRLGGSQPLVIDS